MYIYSLNEPEFFYKLFTSALYLKPEDRWLVCPKTNDAPCMMVFLFVFELSLFLKHCKINKCSFGILKFWKCNYKILTDFKKLVHNMRCIDFLTVSNRRNLSYQNCLHQICQIFKEALFIYSSELKEAYIFLYDITKIISNLFTSHIHRNDCKKVFWYVFVHFTR